LDNILRGLISFFFIGIGFYLLLVGYFKMKFIYILPIVFIVSILITPFLSRIKLGERVLSRYENWLQKTFQKSSNK
jgi:hypothetical protein